MLGAPGGWLSGKLASTMMAKRIVKGGCCELCREGVGREQCSTCSGRSGVRW